MSCLEQKLCKKNLPRIIINKHEPTITRRPLNISLIGVNDPENHIYSSKIQNFDKCSGKLSSNPSKASQLKLEGPSSKDPEASGLCYV